MRVLVLGASGGVGRWVVRLAAQGGHEVTAVIRPTSEHEPPPGVRVLRGEVLDPEFMRSAVAGYRRVISCLGLRRAGPSPWSPLRSPPNLVQRAMRTLVTANEQAAGFRVIWISAGGVGDSRVQATRAVRLLIDAGNLRTAYADLSAAEDVMKGAGVEHVAVRPVTLLPGPPTGRAGAVDRYGLFSTVRRSDVAEWMVAAAKGEHATVQGAVLLGRSRRG